MPGESDTLLNELTKKYKNEQLALFDHVFTDWCVENIPADVIRHNVTYWHGLDQQQFNEVMKDFDILVRTHEQESTENFDLVRTPWEDNIPQ